MRLKSLFIACLMLLACGAMQSCCNECNDGGENYTIKDGVIHFAEPERTPGQETMLAFAAEPIETVRVGFVGIGQRGCGAVRRFTFLEGVEVKGLCDMVQENIDKCQKMLTDAKMTKADEEFMNKVIKIKNGIVISPFSGTVMPFCCIRII